MNTSFALQAQVDALYKQPRRMAFQAQSQDAFDEWQVALRREVIDLLGLTGRTPPENPQASLIHAIDRGDYIEEKYALDVGEAVPAPMYVLVPRAEPPFKAILCFHGHEASVQPMLGNYPDETTGRDHRARDGNYAQALAQVGYLVCAVEQRGFGERISDQHIPPENVNTCRHLAFEYLMQGRTLLGERCWDGMTAINYLRQRDDLVPDVMGCTGLSGGGTTTLWLSAIDQRITAAVVACYFCSFRHSILGMPHCECNYVPRILELAEMGDLAALMAPRPLRIIAGELDPIFPAEGVRQQFETLKEAYALLQVKNQVSLRFHPGGHTYDLALAAEWFGAYL